MYVYRLCVLVGKEEEEEGRERDRDRGRKKTLAVDGNVEEAAVEPPFVGKKTN